MLSLKPMINPSRRLAGKTCLGLLLMFWTSGCGVKSGSPTSPGTPAQQDVQTYFAPYVAGGSPIVPQTYTFDDKTGKFSQTTYLLDPPQQLYSQVINAGVFTVSARGLRSLGITATYVLDSSGTKYVAKTYDHPEPGSFAVELAGQAGGLVQLVNQPVAPLVAATQCPNLKTAQTYLFVTIPAALNFTSPGQDIQQRTWDPKTDTAYGSVDVSSSGSTVNFQNIHQFTLPSVRGTGRPTQQPSSSLTGVCGPTAFGNVTNVPGQLIIPAPGSGQEPPPQAKIGIGPSGFLVEDNGAAGGFGTLPDTSPPLPYNNVLGAGTGAVGLPKPSSALDTNAIAGAQYQGFIYAASIYAGASFPPEWSSHLASFGFPGVPPASCAEVTQSTSTLIYGGDFTKDDPSTSQDGFGNCDFAIDLGTQDPATNGLYPGATVWVGAGYANTTNTTYHFQAVAIAGQLNGKYAIFLIGVDSTQPWAVYLLQSN